MPPPLCFGDAREGTVGDSTPPHPLDQTSSSQLKPTMKIRICGNIFILDSFHIEAQSGADWAEPGFGTWAYRDCIPNHEEGGAGDDEMVPCKPLAKHPCSEAERAKKGGRTGGKNNCSNSRHQHHPRRCAQFGYFSPLLSLAKHPCSEAERTRQGDVGALQPLCRDALVSTGY